MDHVPPQQQHDADGAREHAVNTLRPPNAQAERARADGARTGHVRPLFAALCLLLAAGFAALGAWQVERRAWKLALIERIEARVHASPVSLPAGAAWRDDQAYRRVRVSGIFLHNAETLVQAVTELGAGWWVITPLRSTNGIVLVNRGFVPPERRALQSRRAGLPVGVVTVTGLLRSSEPRGGFLRSNDPAADRWYSRDVAAIARARRVGTIAPFFLDADAAPNAGSYPIGGLTVIAFPNNHLIYALTWFTLVGLSFAGAVVLFRQGGRR